MKKLIVGIIMIILGIWLIVGGILYGHYKTNTIGMDKALNIALDDVANESPQIYDIDIDYERTFNGGVYKVEFATPQLGECIYIIDAKSGDILNSQTNIYDD